MQKTKPSGKGSFFRSILRAFGMDAHAQRYGLPLPSRGETQPDPSVRYFDYTAALWEAERAKAQAIMEFRRKAIL